MYGETLFSLFYLTIQPDSQVIAVILLVIAMVYSAYEFVVYQFRRRSILMRNIHGYYDDAWYLRHCYREMHSNL